MRCGGRRRACAGADDRALLISDDPAHAWVRDTWSELPMDPRLPLTGPVERAPATSTGRSLS